MSQQNDNGFKSFPSGGTFSQFARVKLQSDGTIVAAGLAEKEIGTAQVASLASGELVTVKLRTAAGTHRGIAKESFSAGATLYTEAGGKIQDTAEASAFQIGTALQAAGAENDIVEFLYNAHGDTAAS